MFERSFAYARLARKGANINALTSMPAVLLPLGEGGAKRRMRGWDIGGWRNSLNRESRRREFNP
jgi:hypothetical protein